jgi:hypothetical protein
MAEFRTASGLVSCKMFVRTPTGLVECVPMFRGTGGVVPGGGGTPALTANVVSEFVSGAISRNAAAYVTTNPAQVTVAGGKAPYSYAWSGTPDLEIRAPSSAATTFGAEVAAGGTAYGTYSCTVTDAKGNTATTPQVTASVYNEGGSGGIIQ